MVHPHRINFINALIIISAGLTEYFLNPAKPPLALLPAAIGLLLLACTHLLRKRNWLVFSTASALTILVALLTLGQLDVNDVNWNRREILLLVMGLSSLVTAACFILGYYRERKLHKGALRE